MLKQVSLFANMPDHAIESLSKYVKRHKYPKNTIIFNEGAPCSELYIVEEGKLKIFSQNPNGKEVILNFQGAGDYFGELSLLDGQPRSATVMTVTNVELGAISQRDFKTFLAENHEIAFELMTELTRRVRDLTDNVKDLALLDVYGRVANLLQNRFSGEDGTIKPKLTHQEMADMVGASREMVSRVMKELVVGGYIEQTPKSIIVRKRFPVGW